MKKKQETHGSILKYWRNGLIRTQSLEFLKEKSENDADLLFPTYL